MVWWGTRKFATFQGFVIKWIHNPARNPVSGYKIKWESTKYRSKTAVGTYELSIENWTCGSDETYPKRVLQDFKKVPFFLKIAYFAPLNALRAHTAWSKKQPFYSVFLVTPAYNITLEWPPGGHRPCVHYTCLPVSICSHTQELTPYELLNMSIISVNFTNLPFLSWSHSSAH